LEDLLQKRDQVSLEVVSSRGTYPNLALSDRVFLLEDLLQQRHERLLGYPMDQPIPSFSNLVKAIITLWR
jgi:hypothetical protein